MIGITFALPTESSDLVRRLRGLERHDNLLAGKIDNHHITIIHTGVGAKQCSERLEALLHKTRPKLVISSGFAGAVSDQLQVGDLILAQNFSDAQLRAKAERILHDRQPKSVKLFTSTSILDSTPERNEIARSSDAAAVDMETGAIADVCAAHSVPLVSLRAITDSPSEPFPAPASVLFDLERQRTDLRKLFGYLVTGPTAIIRLIHFGRQVSRARATLTEAIVALIKEI